MASSSTSSSKLVSAVERPGLATAKGGRILPESFYARPTLTVARDLLGKLLITRSRGVVTGGRIVETEAYFAGDPASHSTRRTERSEVMYGRPGVAYVYFIYGNHEMLNFVTEGEEKPGAVLIRGLEPVIGVETMRRRRRPGARQQISNGPGRLCNALGIRMSHNRASLQGPAIAVFDDDFTYERIACSPRVGITKAQDRCWRFFVKGHPDVSRTKQNGLARPARRIS